LSGVFDGFSTWSCAIGPGCATVAASFIGVCPGLSTCWAATWSASIAQKNAPAYRNFPDWNVIRDTSGSFLNMTMAGSNEKAFLVAVLLQPQNGSTD
jgi:hypothetical protein